MPESLFKQSSSWQADLKRDSNTVFFKAISRRLLWKKNFFTFFWQFFTHIPGTFRERFIFQIIGLFWVFMPGFHTMEPRHFDESSSITKQRLWSIHASVNITKIRNVLRSFYSLRCLRILTGKKHPALTKNTNIDIWVVGTSN